MPTYKGNRIRVVNGIVCVHLATHESKHLIFRRGGSLEYRHFPDNDKDDPFEKFNNLMLNAYSGANTMEEDVMIQDSEIISYKTTNRHNDGSFDEIELDMMFEDKIKVDSNGEIYRISKRIFNTTEWVKVSHTNPNEPYVEPVDNDNTEIDSINLYRWSDINNLLQVSNHVAQVNITTALYNHLMQRANELESDYDKNIIIKFLNDNMNIEKRNN